MYLSKVTSWGLIIGGAFSLVGFMIFGISLGLLEDQEPAAELKALQDNQLIVAVMLVAVIGVFTYMAKSLLQVGQAVKVTDEWYMFMRMSIILMLATLFTSMGLWMGAASETTTLDIYVMTEAVGSSIDNIQLITGSFVFFILTVFALKNGAGSLIFRGLIAILGILAVVDMLGVLSVIGDIEDNAVGMVTWFLWGLSLIGIGVIGLRTKEA
ncbi:MAG: hypothetical protein HN926_01170 [Chloroflexi bacterium]|jgi:hypothetical protein|nr:hypothetical protein [Chloroflexota bacterium]NCG40996.1 hypothetical protein [Actinomycetota bacterium]MBT3864164.1 hypothetical protein [Chloroflexota bacterium]MBT4142969.1 hypothetical protein [Chloroflexota bacterium]MBT4943786.1 hypothetical protein [Chloroflexota bacterium]